MFVFSKEDWDYVVPKNSVDVVYYASNADDEGDECISTCMASIQDETYLIVADSPDELTGYINTDINVVYKQTSWLSIGSMFRFILYKGAPRCLVGGRDFRASAITTYPGGPLVPKIYTFVHVAQYEDGTYCMKDGAVVAEANPYDLIAIINEYKLDDRIESIIAMPLMQAAPMFDKIWHDGRVIDMGDRLIHDPHCIEMVFGDTDPEDMEERLLKKLKESK
jgi:hypothetical protein